MADGADQIREPRGRHHGPCPWHGASHRRAACRALWRLARSASMTQTIDALERGIDVLEILADRGSVKLAELPELLGVSRATAFRLLATLQQRGYVERLPAQGGYRLGGGAVILA